MTSSATGLARKIAATAADLERADSRAVTEAALAFRRAVLSLAEARTRFDPDTRWLSFASPKVYAGWYSTVVALRGGFAHLAERGSYKSPGGWWIRPRKATTRRVRAAARRGEVFTAKRSLALPWGPRASAWHPPLRATPFWDAGVAASAPAVKAAWTRALTRTLSRHFTPGG